MIFWFNFDQGMYQGFKKAAQFGCSRKLRLTQPPVQCDKIIQYPKLIGKHPWDTIHSWLEIFLDFHTFKWTHPKTWLACCKGPSKLMRPQRHQTEFPKLLYRPLMKERDSMYLLSKKLYEVRKSANYEKIDFHFPLSR